MFVRFSCQGIQFILLSTLLFFNLLLGKTDPTSKTASTDSSKTSNTSLEKPLFSALSKNDMPSWLKSLDKPEPGPDSLATLRTREFLSKVLTLNSKELQKQYRDHLKLYPDNQGKIILKLFVTPPGAVDKVEILSCSMDNAFKDQVLETVEKWDNLGLCDCDCIKVYVQEFIFGENTSK
ncbi:hypothetical protein GF406_09400 [candidate division KSB1 bacterium]|nr:hypothetical protein [candidate division KSB1 bacterium]